MSTCPGVGPAKVRRLYETFHEPFRRHVHELPAVPPMAAYTDSTLHLGFNDPDEESITLD